MQTYNADGSENPVFEFANENKEGSAESLQRADINAGQDSMMNETKINSFNNQTDKLTQSMKLESLSRNESLILNQG